eukprot:9496802-Pyramimonas_sp.AAC.1
MVELGKEELGDLGATWRKELPDNASMICLREKAKEILPDVKVMEQKWKNLSTRTTSLAKVLNKFKNVESCPELDAQQKVNDNGIAMLKVYRLAICEFVFLEDENLNKDTISKQIKALASIGAQTVDLHKTIFNHVQGILQGKKA